MATSKQIDLFLESIIDAPVKDDQELMARPYFSLQKQPRMEPIVYEDKKNGISMRISPGEQGIATIWDKDILIYCASYIMDRKERGLSVDRKIRFSMYDCLTLTGRGTGKQAYELFKDAAFRLRSTTITTNVQAGGQKEDRGFGWIDNFKIVRQQKNGKDIMVACEITLNDWMFRAITEDKRVLTIDRAYFKLRKGLERRLYELARKHCGYQPEWKIGLPKLAERCGAMSELKEFKRQLNEIIKADPLPGYHVSLLFDPSSDLAKDLKSDGYDTRRWRSNERIIVQFRRRPAEILEPDTEDAKLEPAVQAALVDDSSSAPA